MAKRDRADVETELVAAEAELRALLNARAPLMRNVDSFARVGRLRAEIVTLASGAIEAPSRITDAAAEFIRLSGALAALDGTRGTAAEAELLRELLDTLRAQLSPDDMVSIKAHQRRARR